ncbi:MAG: hypothetical protein COA79_13740 [Planctomycetota bacterium]|nr:MAG: hypothetical protein COA79_13740 [Planctomycetota bacterium]
MDDTHPNYDDIQKQISQIRNCHYDFCTISSLGKSVEDRDITCLQFTDPTTNADQKQRILIVAGQHGSEESGRSIALELIDYIIKQENNEILKQLDIAIVPCVNADGSMANTYRNANDDDIAHSYCLNKSSNTPEGIALENFAMEFIPEVFVDIHGRAGGGMKECMWATPVLSFTPDKNYVTEMANRMHQAAEKAGYPQTDFIVPSSFVDNGDHDLLLSLKLAVLYKTLGFGLETIEKYYKEKEWRASGVARLKELLDIGLSNHFQLKHPGYPNDLISGTKTFGLMAHGKTIAERRISRIELIKFLNNNFCLVDRGADGPDQSARVKIFSKGINGDNPQRFSVIIRIKNPSEINQVMWKGKELTKDPTFGYETWQDDISTFILVHINEPFGGDERFIEVKYDSPYLV